MTGQEIYSQALVANHRKWAQHYQALQAAIRQATTVASHRAVLHRIIERDDGSIGVVRIRTLDSWAGTYLRGALSVRHMASGATMVEVIA